MYFLGPFLKISQCSSFRFYWGFIDLNLKRDIKIIQMALAYIRFEGPTLVN